MFLKRLHRAVTVAVDWTLILLMSVLFFAVLSQVIARYLFRFSFAWSEEFPTLLFVWVAYIGAAGALSEGRHLALLFIRDAAPAMFREVMRWMVGAALVAFFLLIVVLGYQLSSQLGYRAYSTLPISKIWLFLAVPVGCLLMIPVVIVNLVNPRVSLEDERPPDLPQQSVLG